MKIRTLGAGLAALAIASLSMAPAAEAVDDTTTSSVRVTNTETLQVYMTPDGDVQSKRVYEQLALNGHGPVTVENPVSSDGLRNIDGFSGLSVKDGVQTVHATVDGTQRLRSVSNYDGDLPLGVSIKYLLDGKPIQSDDVPGATGELEVIYTVTNETAQPQEISYPDGKGGTITETVSVPVPIVGQMMASLPPSFTEVTSQQAALAGDGQGGTIANFTMTLFPPLGADEMNFSYTAHVKDAVIPPTSITALPVNPLENPTFKTAGDSYKGGADSGLQLADGATIINDNLLRLRDGSAKLLAGLIKLHDGSGLLADGLAGKAAPGARKLSDGLGQLDDGVGQLSAGAQQLADGQRALANGLTKLYNGVNGLPAGVKTALRQNRDYLKLLGSLTSIAEGVGTRADDGVSPGEVTLLGGLNAVENGLDYPGPTDCMLATTGGDPVKCGVVDALQTMGGLLLDTANGADSMDKVEGLRAPLNSLWLAEACPGAISDLLGGGTKCATISQMYDGLFRAKVGPNLLNWGLKDKMVAASTALTTVVTKLQAQLLAPGAGLDKLRAGLSNTSAGDCAAALNTSTKADDCGIREGSIYLRDVGIPLLVDGITANVRTQLLAGIGRPTPGCDPTKTLRCGAEALADGGVKLTDGVGQLVEGVTLLDNGGSQLADGLEAAADGSLKIEAGLGKAADGAPKIVDGAGRLSKEGMEKLIAAGQDTAQQYGKMYATIAAGAKRADQEKMLYGTPKGAQGLTAYSYQLLGDDGQGSRNLQRGVAALALLGLGGCGLLLRRRFI